LAPITATRPDHRSRADFDVGADHGQRIDGYPVLQMRAGIDERGGCDAGGAEPGLRAKGVAVQLARDFHKFPKRLGRAQHRNVGGDPGLEPLADQTRPGLRRSESVGVFQVIENVRCIGPASSSDASPLTCWPPRDGSTKRAFVNAAMAASVDEGGCSKNLGCAIPPVESGWLQAQNDVPPPNLNC